MTDFNPTGVRNFGIPFDLETTGVDPFEDRIVTAFIGLMDTAGDILQHKDYVVNPGVEIPQGAIDVHGITNEHVREHGGDPATAIGDILSIIQLECRQNGLPLIGANIVYDITMLLAEARRHLSPEAAGAAEELLRSIHVIDTYVLDKHLDAYRKGSRTLIDTAAHYGVTLSEEEAHGAQADAIAAGRITLAIMARHPRVSTLGHPPRINLAILHESQQVWKAEQAASFQTWLRTKAPADRRDPAAVIDGTWPIQVAPARKAAA